MEEKTKENEEITSRKETFFEGLAFSVAKNLGSATSLLAHTLFFIVIFSLRWVGFNIEQILLILTTAVSLEAIYMSIFIQMTVNRHSEGLSEVHQHIEEISEDVDEIQEDIEGIQTEVKEIGDDVDEISEDIEDIQEDMEEISDDITEDEDDKKHHDTTNAKLEKIEETLHRLLSDIEGLKK